jgi:flagellar L-ring protein precursor FlgH
MKTRTTEKLVCMVAGAAVALIASSNALGELPGLPADQHASEKPRPADARPQAPAPGPIRGSLFKQGATSAAQMDAGQGTGYGRPTAAISFTSVAVPEPHRYKKNDLITVIVREESDSVSNGSGSSKKTQDYDLALQQFIQMAVASSGIPYVTTVNNPSKLPEIKFKYNTDRQTDADQSRNDSLSIRISATVVDVKPNGTMVIEATKHITVDKEEQYMTLSGICRADDIASDNTIISTQLADLAVSKQTKGNVHDGTKRGWLNNLIDTFSPF